MKKFLLVLLGIVTLNLCAFAIESDFKNSLLKVEYVKTGADSYNIKLFTQKPYNEPIKVIKKTNTNYYILLPETFHSVGSVAPLGDIKSTEVKLFPYAGQDLNNGYTKISIFTSKPLNIKAQLNSSTKSVAPSINAKELAKLDSAFGKAQTSNEQAQRQAQLKAKQEAQRQAQLKAQQAREAAQKAEAQRQAQLKAQQEAQRQAQARAQAQKEAQLKAQQEAQRQAQIKAQQEAQRQAQLKAQQETQKTKSNNLQVAPEAAEAYYKKHGQGSVNEKKSQAEPYEGAPQNLIPQDEIFTEDIENENIEEIPDITDKTKNETVGNLKDGIINVLSKFKPYYYIIADNLILFAALAVAFIGIVMLIAMNKNKKRGLPKTMDKEQNPDIKKHYDLEKLSKEINDTYKTGLEEELSNKAAQEAQAFRDEFKDLMEEKPEQPKVPDNIDYYEYENTKEPEEKEDFTVQEEYTEPEVISSVEIAPKRGFMIIETQGTKALFGYIYDNVFLLYQFKEFISDCDIKYRISEKQYDRTFFIIKVDRFKLLVRVTATSMRLELEM